MIKCNFCNELFAKPSELLIHMHANHATIECEICTHSFTNIADYRACIERHNQEWAALTEDDLYQINLLEQALDTTPQQLSSDETRKRQRDDNSPQPSTSAQAGNEAATKRSRMEPDNLNDDQIAELDPGQMLQYYVTLINNFQIISQRTCVVRECRYKSNSSGSTLNHIKHCHPEIWIAYFNHNQYGFGEDNQEIIDDTEQVDSGHHHLRQTHEVIFEKGKWIDYMNFLIQHRPLLKQRLVELLRWVITVEGVRVWQYKVSFTMEGIFEKQEQDGSVKDKIYGITTPMYEVLDESDISRVLTLMMHYIDQRVDDYIENDSGSSFKQVTKFKFTVNKMHELAGGCLTYKELAEVFKNKKGTLINIFADDQLCFKRAILTHFELLKVKKQTLSKDQLYRRRKMLSDECYYRNIITKEQVVYREGELCETNSEIIVDFTKIKYPVSIRDVKIFSKNNPNIKVCVFGYEDVDIENNDSVDINNSDSDDDNDDVDNDSGNSQQKSSREKSKKYRRNQKELKKKLYPLFVSMLDTEYVLDLLYVYNENGEGHFIYIESLRTLLGTQNVGKKYDMCRHCLNWVAPEKLADHRMYCKKFGYQKTETRHDTIQFNEYHKTIPSAFTFFCDFECLLSRISQAKNENQMQTKVAMHEPSGYGWICVDYKNELVEWNYHRNEYNGEKPEAEVKQCLEEMLKLSKKLCKQVTEWNNEAQRTMINQQIFDEQNFNKLDCYICGKSMQGCMLKSEIVYNDDDDEKTISYKNSKIAVRHHSHFPPFESLGWAHTKCNINASIRKQFSCYMHNFASYDSHFILAALEDHKVDLIGSSSEKMTQISVDKLINFVDSITFFGGKSLAACVESLNDKRNENVYEDFNVLRQVFKQKMEREGKVFNDQMIELIKEKGIYPYTYMDSPERFNETRLPPIEEFFNDLKQESLSQDDYEHATKVWHEYQVKNLGEWHDLYVMTDVALLACCFIKQRKVMMNSFGLDLAHYISLPSYSLSAMLKYTKAKVEPISDINMYIFLEHAIRGGFSGTGSQTVAKANNKFCSNYQDDKPTSFIHVLDKCNLYGYALTQRLPYKNYRWLEEETLEYINNNLELFLSNLKLNDEITDEKNASCGFILDVSISYPEKLHDKFKELPPVPAKRCVSYDELSPLQHSMAEAFGVNKHTLEGEKMIACLTDKRVICHYRALTYWKELGVEITQVHNGIRFQQIAWMKPYIDYNSAMRAKANTPLEVNLRKFLNNSLYGKQIQNLRNRKHLVLLTNTKQFLRYTRKPSLQHIKPISENISLAVLQKQSIKLASPMASGVSCLDDAKKSLYSFYYDFVQVHFPNHVLLFTDTDSLALLIYHDDTYEVFKLHEKDFFDLSGFPKEHAIWGKYHSVMNKKRVNWMQDEYAGQVISDMVVLKSKMYADLMHKIDDNGKPLENSEGKKCKGIPRASIKHQVKFNDYLECKKAMVQTHVNFNGIRSFNHSVYSIEQCKKALNALDNKRFYVDNNYSLPFGHKDIKKCCM